MNTEGFRQRDDIEDRTYEGVVPRTVRLVADGVRGGAAGLRNQVMRGDSRAEPEPDESPLGDEAGMKDLPKPAPGGAEYYGYADGGAIPDPALYGAPLGGRDTSGAAVNPMISTSRGGVASGAANPMAYEDGGAIPDDSDEPYLSGGEAIPQRATDDDLDDPNQDDTTQAFSQALKAVNAGLMFGRQKHGLPTGNEEDAGGGGDEGAIPEFAEGGAVPEGESAEPGRDELLLYNDPDQNLAEGVQDDLGKLAPRASAEGDNSGMGPVFTLPDDNSGMGPVADVSQQQRGSQQAQATPLAYLMGADGVAPEVLDNYKQGATGTEADRNLAAIQNAYNDKGPEGAWGVLQSMRRKFDLFMNHGRAAVDKGDYASAAQSATQAMNHLPDGSNAAFVPSNDGLVAVLQSAGGERSQVPLSKQAADAFMNTGKTGQFDALLENGVNKALQSATRGTGYMGQNGLDKVRGLNNVASQAAAVGQQRPMDPDADREVAMGHDVTQLRASDQYRKNFPENYARGQKENIPGNVRIDPGPRRDAPAGKAGKTAAGGADHDAAALEREKLKQEGLNKRAQMTTERQMAGNKSRDDRAKSSQTFRETFEGKKLSAQMAINEAKLRNGGLITSDEVRQIYDHYGLGQNKGQQSAPAQQGGGEAPTQQRAPAQQQPKSNASASPSAGQPPEKGAKLYKGQWYRRGPNGEAELIQ